MDLPQAGVERILVGLDLAARRVVETLIGRVAAPEQQHPVAVTDEAECPQVDRVRGVPPQGVCSRARCALAHPEYTAS